MPTAIPFRPAARTARMGLFVAAGQFREDLYHRLDLYRIPIPPLRECGEDILELAGRLVAQLCQKQRLPGKPLSPAGRRRLTGQPWPGNVRELAHELERAIVFEDGAELNFPHLETSDHPVGSREGGPDWFNANFRFPNQGFDLERAIRQLSDHAVQQSDNNGSAAARMLGVTRDYLRYRLSGQKSDPPP